MWGVAGGHHGAKRAASRGARKRESHTITSLSLRLFLHPPSAPKLLCPRISISASSASSVLFLCFSVSTTRPAFVFSAYTESKQSVVTHSLSILFPWPPVLHSYTLNLNSLVLSLLCTTSSLLGLSSSEILLPVIKHARLECMTAPTNCTATAARLDFAIY